MTETTRGLAAHSILPGHAHLSEPLLRFHADREEDTDAHPLKGLCRFGPYSRSILGAVPDPIRVAVIGPGDADARVDSIVGELSKSHRRKGRNAYAIEFPGFSAVFGTRVVKSSVETLTLPDPDKTAGEGHLQVAESLSRAISAMGRRRSEFDVLLIYLPKRWEPYFFHRQPGAHFDLHDWVKSHAASLAVSTQIIREDSAIAYFDRCSVMWRLGIAIFTKSGGIPWSLSSMPIDTMYIGLGYAVKKDSEGKPQFVTACSQVFGSDGIGFEFLGYGTKEAVIDKRDNVFLSRGDMFRVLSRSLDLYQHRNSGRSPASVVVHKSTEFKEDEINGAFDAFSTIDSVELVQIRRETGWRGVHLDEPQSSKTRSTPGYAVLRGTCLPVGPYDALLWTQGNAPDVCGGKNFYKEMKGTPRPLGIRRFAGHGPMSAVCQTVLAFTKMDWNNDALYNRIPVTLSFANYLASLVKTMPSSIDRPYSVRLFM